MNTKFKGYIFDMDGTIIDSKINFKALYEHFELPAGHGLLEHIAKLTDEAQISRAHEVLDHYEMQGALLSKPIDHAFEFLSYLNEEKIPTALFTRNSKKVTEKTLAMHNLKFDVCLTRDDIKAKPDPAGLLKIQKLWDFTVDEILFVGDYKYDLWAGLAAKMPTALYLNESADFDTSGSHFNFKHFSELKTFVKKS